MSSSLCSSNNLTFVSKYFAIFAHDSMRKSLNSLSSLLEIKLPMADMVLLLSTIGEVFIREFECTIIADS